MAYNAPQSPEGLARLGKRVEFSHRPRRAQQAWASPCARRTAAACQQPWLCSSPGLGDITKLLRSERGGEQDPKSPKNRVSNRGPALQAEPGPRASCAAQPRERPCSRAGLGTNSLGALPSRPRCPRLSAAHLPCPARAAHLLRSPTRVGGGGAARRRGRIPGSDATAGARRAFPPLANGFALARRGLSCDPGPAPGTLAMDGEAALRPRGVAALEPRGLRREPPLPRAVFLPFLRRGVLRREPQAGWWHGAGRAARGLTQLPLSVEGALTQCPSWVGVRVTLDSFSSAPPTRVGAIGSGFLSL